MAHLTARSGYRQLVERLNRFPQGAAPSPLLDRILQLLFTPDQAELVAKLPLRPFRVGDAAKAWGLLYHFAVTGKIEFVTADS